MVRVETTHESCERERAGQDALPAEGRGGRASGERTLRIFMIDIFHALMMAWGVVAPLMMAMAATVDRGTRVSASSRRRCAVGTG